MNDSIKRLGSIIKEKAKEEDHIDWTAKLDEWKAQVEVLYKQVESWLNSTGAASSIKISKRNKTLNEQYIGTYQISDLVLKIGKQEISFIPKGALIIAAKGRVDVVCGIKRATLLLLGENETPGVHVEAFGSVQARDAARARQEKERAEFKPGKLVWKIGKKSPRLETNILDEAAFVELMEQLLS